MAFPFVFFSYCPPFNVIITDTHTQKRACRTCQFYVYRYKLFNCFGRDNLFCCGVGV